MSVITVMIADDERLVIEDMLNLFDWEENGFEIVSTPSNGNMAYEEYRKLMPQIIITDIRMPFMDGLGLIRKIRESDVQTKILLLSAYSDFHYAKKAIELGITDYMLKNEINSQTIKEKLMTIRRQILRENKVSVIIAQKLLADMFSAGNTYTGYEYGEDMRHLINTPYCYMIIDQDLPLKISNDMPASRHIGLDLVSHCFMENTSDAEVVCAGMIGFNRVLVIIHPVMKLSQNHMRALLYSTAEKLQQNLENHFRCSFCVFTVYEEMTLDNFRQIYIENTSRLGTGCIRGNGKIYDFLDPSLGSKVLIPGVNRKRLQCLVDGYDLQGMEAYLEELFSEAVLSGAKGLLAVSRTLYQCLEQYIKDMSDMMDAPDIDPAHSMQYWMTADGILKWMKEKYISLIYENMMQGNKKYSPEVVRAAVYIRENFCDRELNIDHICTRAGLSAARLSVKFKAEMNKTVNDFITEVRVKHAKQLLLGSTMKIYEIAEAVGYGSGQYFSQLFLRITGMTPNDFKRCAKK